MSSISNLVNKSFKQNRPLDILTLFYDGRFDIELLKTGHNFYGLLETSVHPWPGYVYADYPNLHILNNEGEFFARDFDLMLLHSRDKHARFSGMPQGLHIPAIHIDHDFMPANPYYIHQSISSMPFETVGCGSVVSKLFKSVHNIEYGIDSDNNQIIKDIDMLVCGTFANQDAFFVNHLKSRFPKLLVCGRPNESVPYAQECQTYEEYKSLFKRAKIFVNLPSQGNICHEILWALKYQCLIVTPMLQPYNMLEHGKNCLVVGNLGEIPGHIDNLLSNAPLRQKLSSHSTDLSIYDNDKFVESWNNILESYRSKVFIL